MNYMIKYAILPTNVFYINPNTNGRTNITIIVQTVYIVKYFATVLSTESS